ncbi:Geraniol 8-hydroxylase [Linum grandiflorum]
MDLSICSWLLCLLTTTLTILLLRLLSTKTQTKLPPGPSRLPIIGNLHNLGDKPHQSLAHLAKIHGPLMSLKLGQVTTIVASSPSVAKEILQKHDQVLSNRQLNRAFWANDHHEHGMSLLPVGPKWRNLRKVCNTYLFTSQKLDSNQDLRRRKIQELLDGVRRSAREGKAVDIGGAAFRASLSAMSMMVMSLDLTADEGSRDVVEFKEATRGIMDESGKPNLGDFFPVLGVLDLQGIQRRMASHSTKVLNLFGRLIEERLNKRKSEAYVTGNDMLDTLLDIGEGNPEASMDSEVIKHLFLDLFVAGTDTTSSTLEWAMVELLCNPNIFGKVRKELDETIGKENHLEESDIARLPFLQAVIKETFRLHPAVPLLIPRKAGSDVEVCGFTVPKGSQILVNAWAMGRDSTIWDNPNSFMPQRFMGSEIDVRGNGFELIPFGGGRRICPGLPLAIRMLHMMLGSLVHWFDWKLENGVDSMSLDMKEEFGITLKKAKPLLVVPAFI